MRRRLFPLTILLSAVTALSLTGAAVSIRPPAVPAAADDAAKMTQRVLVYAFYDAVNLAIATGDLAALTNLVAPELLADGASGRAGPDHGDLRRRLLALHATLPTLRLTVEAVAVDGDLVIAQVSSSGVEGPAFLGLTVREQPIPWGPDDVLRLADGRVVAHEGGTPDAGLLEPALAAGFDLPATPSRLAIHRLTIAPGIRHVAESVTGPRLLFLEAGALTIEVVATAMFAAPSATLTKGEYLALPARVTYSARAIGDAPVMLLDLAVSRLDDAPVPQFVADGVTASLLAHSLTSALPTGPVVLGLGRATLVPGTRLAWTEVGGPTLLYVETGTASLDPGVGIAWVDGGHGRSTTLGDDPLAAGDGALVVAGNAAAVRATSAVPATILIVTLLPAEPAPATNAPSD